MELSRADYASPVRKRGYNGKIGMVIYFGKIGAISPLGRCTGDSVAIKRKSRSND